MLSGRWDSVANLSFLVLEIFNISDPANPLWITAYETGSAQNSAVRGLALSGRYAYVATDDGLQVLDLSEPTIPRWVGGYDVDQRMGTTALAVSGNHAVLGLGFLWDGTQSLGGGFLVLDISDPTQPRLAYEDSADHVFNGFAFFGDYVLATRPWQDEVSGQYNIGLEAIDLSNPASPQWVDTYNTRTFGGIGGVRVFGQHVYVIKGEWGLEILRLVTPSDHVGLSAWLDGDSLRLAWPSTATGFALENSSDPTATTWHPVPGTPQLNGDQYELTVPADGPARFFRLRKP